ncbi:MAG: polyprenol phosphomannose-dependent alpha 1,6 mannosyltransferase MptB [Candidatus Nanopelagicales bacterium]
MYRVLGANPHIKHYAYTLLGAILLGYAALALGWLPPLFDTSVNTLLNFARGTDVGILLGRIAIVIATGIIISQWLVLGSNIRKGIDNSHLQWRLFWIWTLPLVFAPAIFSRDVYSYIAQGRLVLAGLNPYVDGVSVVPGWFHLGVDPLWATTPTPYGQLWILIEVGVTSLTPDSPYWSMVLFRVLSILAVVSMAIGILKLAHHFQVSSSLALWLSLTNPLTLFHLIGAAHNDSFMLALLIWAFYFSTKSNRSFAVLLVICAGLIKPIALLALVVVVLGPDLSLKQKFTRWLLAISAAIALLSFIGVASSFGLEWIRALSAPGEVLTLLSPSSTFGYLLGLLTETFSIASIDVVLSIVRIAIFGAALVGIAIYLVQTRAQNIVRVGAYTFAIVVIASPVLQPWYVLWVLLLISPIGIRSVLHLRLAVFTTIFLVAYSTIEVEVARDFNLSFGDFVSVLAVFLVMLLTFITSKRVRDLVSDIGAGDR